MSVRFNKEKFANLIKEYRGTRLQNVVADELGISRPTLSLLENCKQIPSLDILQNFCEKVGLAVDSFFIKENNDPVLLMMGKLKETDHPKLFQVLNRIKIREKYIAISKRCVK